MYIHIAWTILERIILKDQFSTDLKTITRQADAEPQQALRQLYFQSHDYGYDNRNRKIPGYKDPAPEMCDNAVRIGFQLYRQSLQAANTAYKNGSIDKTAHAKSAFESKFYFYNMLVSMNYQYTKALETRIAPFFKTWLKAPGNRPGFDWRQADTDDKGDWLAESEAKFWEIADPDGTLHKLNGITKDRGRVSAIASPDTNLPFACYDSARYWIEFNDTFIDTTQCPEYVSRHLQETGGRLVEDFIPGEEPRQRVFISHLNAFESAQVVLAHEITHKFDYMAAAAFEKDPAFVGNAYGYTNRHYLNHRAMERIYDPSADRALGYTYLKNLNEVLPISIQEKAEKIIQKLPKLDITSPPVTKAPPAGKPVFPGMSAT